MVNILGSTALSQLLIIASTPLLTRIYSKSDFGWFGVATTASLLLATLLSLKLEHSIHVSPAGAKRVFSACLHIVAAVFAGLLLPATILVSLLSERIGANAWLVLLYALGLVGLACGLLKLNYDQRFRRIAWINILVPLIFIVGALTLPDVTDTLSPLLFWQALSYLSGAVVAIGWQRRDIERLSRSEVLEILQLERASALFLVPSQMCSLLSLNMSVIGTAWLFSDDIAGLVVIAQRIARVPVTMIGNALNEVLRAAIPERRQLLRTFQWIAIICVSTALAMLLLVALLPEFVYGWVLGDAWTGIQSVLMITVVGAGFQLVSTSVISMLTAFEKHSDLLINGSLLCASALALLITWLLNATAHQYLWIHVAFTAIIYSAGFVLALRIARQANRAPC